MIGAWRPWGRVDEISAAELADALASDMPPQLLDVRSTLEFRRDHIEGARSAPVTRLIRQGLSLESLDLDPDQPIVVICLSAHRSIPVVRQLQRRGVRNVRQLAGGMLAWRKYHPSR